MQGITALDGQGEIAPTVAPALAIESAAKRRLADGYDSAQDRGEVATGRPKSIQGENSFTPTLADIGLTGKDIREARLIR